MDTEYRPLENENDGPALKARGRNPADIQVPEKKKQRNGGSIIIMLWGLVAIVRSLQSPGCLFTF